MIIKLDPESPVPLYHQLAEALRYQIATGRLTPGQTMPPVRDGHAMFGVNLHTVRRAYTQLAKDGLVTIDGARGTRVASGADVFTSDIDRFIADTLRNAKAKFGLNPTEFAQTFGWAITFGPSKTRARVCAGVQRNPECRSCRRTRRGLGCRRASVVLVPRSRTSCRHPDRHIFSLQRDSAAVAASAWAIALRYDPPRRLSHSRTSFPRARRRPGPDDSV